MHRLSHDLRRHDLEVTPSLQDDGSQSRECGVPDLSIFDFCCIVVSSHSSNVCQEDLTKMTCGDSSPTACVVIPIRLAGGELPTDLQQRKYAEFSDDYENGVCQLLMAFGRVVVQSLPGPSTFELVSARRGMANHVGSFPAVEGIEYAAKMAGHRMTCCSSSWTNVGIVTLVEAVGNQAFTAEVTRAAQVYQMWQATRGQLTCTADEIMRRLFNNVNSIVRKTNEENHLAGNHRVAAKLAIALLVDDTAYFGGVGSIGCVSREGNGLLRREPVSEYPIDLNMVDDDDNALYMRAPLGFLRAEGLKFEPVSIPLSPGDYIALTSFALPYTDHELHSLLGQLRNCRDSKHVTRCLVRSYWPLCDDAMACLARFTGTRAVEDDPTST